MNCITWWENPTQIKCETLSCETSISVVFSCCWAASIKCLKTFRMVLSFPTRPVVVSVLFLLFPTILCNKFPFKIVKVVARTSNSCHLMLLSRPTSTVVTLKELIESHLLSCMSIPLRVCIMSPKIIILAKNPHTEMTAPAAKQEKKKAEEVDLFLKYLHVAAKWWKICINYWQSIQFDMYVLSFSFLSFSNTQLNIFKLFCIFRKRFGHYIFNHFFSSSIRQTHFLCIHNGFHKIIFYIHMFTTWSVYG